jgi:hypothetical protein
MAPAEELVSGGGEEDRRGEDRFKIRDLFADEWCSQAILDNLATTDVGRWIPDVTEEDAPNDASEREKEVRRRGRRPRS